MRSVQIIGVENLPVIREGDNIAALICEAVEKQGLKLMEDDILVLTHVAVSRAEGNVVDLKQVKPSQFARTIAEKQNKDPALVEVILNESKSIVRMAGGKLITESKHGFICANAGVDKSNVPGRDTVALLPKNADESAWNIKRGIKKLTGRDVAVIVSDTHGRPLRLGEINVAIGVAGINPTRDRRGEKDLFGYMLRVKKTAVGDELASAAELVIGQADEGVPAAIIRGYKYVKSHSARATDLVRPREEDLFI